MPLRDLFVCRRVCTNRLPSLSSEIFSVARRQMRVSKEIWRLAPSKSVKAYVAYVKLWSHLDRCGCSIWRLPVALTMNITKCRRSSIH